MNRAGGVVLPLLLAMVWLAALLNPDLIPGHYETTYLLVLIFAVVIGRAIMTARKPVKARRAGANPAADCVGEPPVAVSYPAPAALPTPTPAVTPPPMHAPTGVDALPPELVARLRELRTGGRTIEAVELLREHTGMELYEASRLIVGLDA